nr:hypothetical protein CFP56_09535 [Quercus suber]
MRELYLHVFGFASYSNVLGVKSQNFEPQRRHIRRMRAHLCPLYDRRRVFRIWRCPAHRSEIWLESFSTACSASRATFIQVSSVLRIPLNPTGSERLSRNTAMAPQSACFIGVTFRREFVSPHNARSYLEAAAMVHQLQVNAIDQSSITCPSRYKIRSTPRSDRIHIPTMLVYLCDSKWQSYVRYDDYNMINSALGIRCTIITNHAETSDNITHMSRLSVRSSRNLREKCTRWRLDEVKPILRDKPRLTIPPEGDHSYSDYRFNSSRQKR